MPTVPELERAFHVYFGEIERCRTNDCHWALLHVLVSLPVPRQELKHRPARPAPSENGCYVVYALDLTLIVLSRIAHALAYLPVRRTGSFT